MDSKDMHWGVPSANTVDSVHATYLCWLLRTMLPCRSTWEGECFQSECKLVCDDLVRLGYDRIVIDPSVRMTYKLEDARRRYDSESVRRSFCSLPSCPVISGRK